MEASEENSKAALPLNKVLELLMGKVQNGRPLPQGLDSPPWRIPTSASDHAAQINQILNKSMEIQSSKIPDSDDFDCFIISNSCLAISGLLRFYLQNLGLSAKARVTFGVLLWDANAREGPDDYEGTPHVWLDLEGCPIDNTYVALPEESEVHLEYFYKAKKANYYSNVDPLSTKMNLYLGSGEALETTRHNLRVFKTYVTNDPSGELVEKYLVFALECAALNPCVKMYDLLMRKFLKEEFNAQLPDLVGKWAKMCWSCSATPPTMEELKTCTDCKLAKYCGKDCQKADWKPHKLLHRELALTQQVLAENDQQ